MKPTLILLILLTTLACRQNTNQQQFSQFINGYYNEGFESFSNLLADSITIKDGDYMMTYSKQAFKIFFQWDSAFNMKHELLDFTVGQSSVDYTESLASVRFQFLQDTALVTKKRVHFKDQKITMLEVVKNLNADWKKWIARRYSLVNWVNVHHPELNGFIYDMTPQGAEQYKKAIALIEKEYK
ncbi:hypothetical protein J1N10_19450 [Carboxylicivirga sp. A043]|uniref:hypothetical protein n=1 Tax=Carboxylicivirga litoralis TaxID=2816963 RepID=UPI0021CB32E7|nr:hypothetical protein [Carboxylicivirga sp. A043]MCU4158159.1 hypothetical protein [Carboxylicivirga sp. A043]